MKKHLCLASLMVGVAFLLALVPVHAAPVFGKVFDWTQPDGTPFQVRVWGDEFYRFVESMDGYTLVQDPETKFTCYARLSADGNELVSTGVPAHEPLRDRVRLAKSLRINRAKVLEKVKERRSVMAGEKREAVSFAARMGAAASGPTFPRVGTVNGITIIIDFSDEVATIPRNEINNMLNQPGYSGYSNNGSVRDYFYDVSDGRLTYTNYTPPTYYRAQKTKSYYNDQTVQAPYRARELLLEALNSMNNAGFDFSQYDSNGDGYIDAINVFYAGETGSNWAYGLWPHSSGISFNADGVYSYNYQITNLGASLEIGTFCHENGHMICDFPDLYDYGYESNGVGLFCLMSANGTTNPQEVSAFLKEMAGWTNTTVLTASQNNLNLTAGVNNIYKIIDPLNPFEYYMIENRNASGRDTILPDSGIAVWHVDEKASNDNEHRTKESHYLCSLVQADGNWDLEKKVNQGDNTDLFKAGYKDNIGNATTPDTKWWDATISGITLSGISAPGANMSFSYTKAESVVRVAPYLPITFTGLQGGPFTPSTAVFQVHNGTLGPIDGTVTTGANWLSVGGGSGTIPAGQTVEVEVSLSANAFTKQAGVHNDTILFNDTTNGRQVVRVVTLVVNSVGVETVIASSNMDEYPAGWTGDTGWQYGSPSGLLGNPGAAHTGTKVIGTHLAGHYPNNYPHSYLRMPVLDCTNYTGVKLSFWRWLGVEAYDWAYVEVSNNGTNWTMVYLNPDENDVADTQWTKVEYDISSIADGKSTVYIRWGLMSDESVTYCGWNIDDVVVSGLAPTSYAGASFDAIQNFTVEADNNYYAGVWNFNGSSWTGESSGNSSGQFGASMPEGGWLCYAVQDTTNMSWKAGAYYYYQRWVSQPGPLMGSAAVRPAAGNPIEQIDAAPPRFAATVSPTQTFSASGFAMQLKAWNYGTGSFTSETSGAGAVSLNVNLPLDQWVVVCLYNESIGQYVEGVYVYRQNW
jgi:M6 family metalloprotease-like protein